MPTPDRPRAYTFSLLTAAVLAIQAATGPFVAGLYRDGVWVSSVLRGQDGVALVVVLPVLLVSHVMVIAPAFQAAAGVADAWMMVPVWVLMGAGFLTGAAALIRPAGQPL